VLGWWLPLEAATRGIPVITTAVTQVADTVRAVGYVLAIVLVIVAAYEYRQHSGMGIMFSLVGVIFVAAIVVFADDIINFIKPGAALAFSGGIDPRHLTGSAVSETSQILWPLVLLTQGIYRVRAPRRLRGAHLPRGAESGSQVVPGSAA